MSRPGPWIVPELENGWSSASAYPFRWRIASDGALCFEGQTELPTDHDQSKPLMQFNAIYKHFFGQEITKLTHEDEKVTFRIDDEGWLYVEREDHE